MTAPQLASSTTLLLGVCAYLVLQLALGLYVSRRVASERDYLLANRSLGPVVTGFSFFATWFGAETCMGAAGLAYTGGLANLGAEPFGYAMCLVLMALLALPLWRRKLTTLGDLYRARYGKRVERLAILLLVPTSLLWAAAQIRAFGLVLSSLSGISMTLACTGAALLVLIYTASGGLRADVVTDVVQGSVLVLGMGAMLFVVLFVAEPHALQQVPAERLTLPTETLSSLELMELLAVPMLGSLMAQELVQRVSASRTPKVARNAALGAALAYLSVGLIPVVLGLVAADLVPGVADPEQVLLTLAGQYLPFGLQLLFVGALVSAMLSTVDSSLLVSGSLLAHNLVFAERKVDERTKLRGNRLAVMASGVCAYLLGLMGTGVHELVQEASSFSSSGVLVISMFALFSGFGGAASATAALLIGVSSYVVGQHLLGISAPFLTSLAAASVAYVGIGLVSVREPSLETALNGSLDAPADASTDVETSPTEVLTAPP